MRQRDFWTGFACGAATVVGTTLAVGRWQRGGSSRILRLEKSVQIASPVKTVFETWSDFPRLAELSSTVSKVRNYGSRTRWEVNVNGIPLEWEAEVTQILPNEAIGWKSVSGPKHSGRITFSPLGNDTLVHVQMNYQPPARFLRQLLSPYAGDMEGFIEQVLREFKAGLEGSSTAGTKSREGRATGT